MTLTRDSEPVCAAECANTIESRLTAPLIPAKELVEPMDFRPNLFLGLERHDHKLTMLSHVKHSPKLAILDSEIFDILHKAFDRQSPKR